MNINNVVDKFKHNIVTIIPYLCIFLFIFALLIIMLIKREYWGGLDSYFHMNSIYEDAMQIKTGHFSYFISLFGFERSGRIINSLYGPIFNYICGALLLLCRTWINFEFVLFLVTLFIGSVGVYKCANLLYLNKWISTILALIYVVSRPVLVMWVSNSEFTGLGVTLLIPYVLIIGIKIARNHRIKVLSLTVIMAICLQIHLITSLIAAMVLVPFILHGFSLSKNKLKMIKDGLVAIFATICLSGNIFGALYEVFHSNRLISTFPNYNLQSIMGNNALTIRQYMITDLWQVYTLLFVAVIILTIVRFKSMTSLDWCLLLEDLFFIFISSKYFPWNYLAKICPKLEVIIQFPSRFAAVSFILTLLLFGKLINISAIACKWKYIINGLFCLMALLIFILGFQQVRNNVSMWNSPRVVYYWAHRTSTNGFNKTYNADQIRKDFQSHNLGANIYALHKVIPDYLPTTHRFNINRYYRLPIYKKYTKAFKYQNVYHKYTRNHKLLMNWRSYNNYEIQIPLVKYGNTIVKLNHKRISPNRSLIGTMFIKPREGFNHLSISYHPGHVFKIMSFVSILSWLILLLSIIYKWIIKVLKDENYAK